MRNVRLQNIFVSKRGPYSIAQSVKSKLNAEQLGELNDCFKLMDDVRRRKSTVKSSVSHAELCMHRQDSSGSIDITELEAAFRMLGFNFTHAELVRLVKASDKDGSGESGREGRKGRTV